MQLSLIGGRSSVMYVLIRKYWIFLQAIVMSFWSMVLMLRGKSKPNNVALSTSSYHNSISNALRFLSPV